jgi:release factor glutamine methyltransferase
MSQSELFTELTRKAEAELEFLTDKPEENPISTISALWYKAAGTPVAVEKADNESLPDIDEAQIELLYDLYNKRCSGIPLQHLTERQMFCDIELLAGPEALIPRKETEILGNAALEAAVELGKQKDTVKVLDVCTGAGNIACLIAHHVSNAQVYASDISEEAVSLAKRNSVFLNLENKIEYRCGDLLKPFEDDSFFKTIDLLTCNPPYISSTRVENMNTQIINFEPRLAFDGGPFGIRILQKLIHEAQKFLGNGGWLVFETGLGQGEAMGKRLKNVGFSEVTFFYDTSDNVRALKAKWPE